MAQISRVYVEGLNDLRKELRQADRKLPRELGKANKKAADIVAQEAKRNAPEGPHEGGDQIIPIKRSIKALRRAKAAQVAIGGPATPHAQVYEYGGTIPRRGFAGVTASEKRKGRIVEGKRRGRDIRKRRVKVAVTQIEAQPYLWPAIRAKRGEVRDAYGDLLDALMRRAFPDPE